MNKKTNRNQKIPDARTIATSALQGVLTRHIHIDEALSQMDGFACLERRDRAFARLLVTTSLRRLGQIDRVLSKFLQKQPGPFALSVLRTGVAQILFLGTPAHAAVNGAVKILKAQKKATALAPLANAVLRRVSDDGMKILMSTNPADNLPKWIRKNWNRRYGIEACQAMAEQLACDPPLDITVKPEPGYWAKALQADILPGGTLRRRNIGNITELPGFSKGAWWVQDMSASLPAKLLGNITGRRVLDMCSAPGGKTLQLAAGGANVIALDSSAARQKHTRANLERTGLSAHTAVADGRTWRDPDNCAHSGFDAVLLDAPCSSTGIFRRNPEVLYAKKLAYVESLAHLQTELLQSAALHVKPGGTLIYCTCSLETQEGEAQITEFLKNRSDFRLWPVLSKEIFGLSKAITETGCVRILPHFLHNKGGMDGFFIARFTRC